MHRLIMIFLLPFLFGANEPAVQDKACPQIFAASVKRSIEAALNEERAAREDYKKKTYRPELKKGTGKSITAAQVKNSGGKIAAELNLLPLKGGEEVILSSYRVVGFPQSSIVYLLAFYAPRTPIKFLKWRVNAEDFEQVGRDPEAVREYHYFKAAGFPFVTFKQITTRTPDPNEVYELIFDMSPAKVPKVPK